MQRKNLNWLITKNKEVIIVKQSDLRVRMDIEFIKKASFIDFCKKTNKNHFTRKRKMPLSPLILSILNRKGLTLTMELRKFFKLINSKEKISKPGYLKQRKKLNPKAFMLLSDFHVKNFYKDVPALKSFKGYFLFAIDGSSANIPTTKENIELYGNSSRKNVKLRAQLGISCIYDVLNKMIIDCTINKWKFSEREQAEIHIKKLNSFIGNKPYITIFDRGYPSSEFFINRLEKEQKFLMRLSSTSFKREQLSMLEEDEDVEIVFDKTRIRHYIGTDFGNKLNQLGFIQLRFVRLKLPTREFEYLATNLSREEFSTEEIFTLYSCRWGIETVYDILKNKLELENFTGSKPIIIEQDIFSTIYLCNLVHDLLFDAEEEQKARNQGKYKYAMTINKSIAIGIIKEDLIFFILEPDGDRKTEIFEKIIKEISENILPIREDRHYERAKGQLAGKYSNTRKRSY